MKINYKTDYKENEVVNLKSDNEIKFNYKLDVDRENNIYLFTFNINADIVYCEINDCS
jgi:hypothetical protein